MYVVCTDCAYRLRNEFEEGQKEGPTQSQVEFSQMYEHIQKRYPELSRSHAVTCIRRAFPQAEPKRSTQRGHKTFYIGICWRHAGLSIQSDSVPKLTEDEHSLSAAQGNFPQQHNSRREEYNIVSEALLQEQIRTLLSHGGLVVHGPDSLSNLEKFSINGVMEEVRHFAPDLLRLFDQLGDVHRNADGEDVTHEQINAFVALSALLNACSRKCTGLQLFIGMMLVARATNRQV